MIKQTQRLSEVPQAQRLSMHNLDLKKQDSKEKPFDFSLLSEGSLSPRQSSPAVTMAPQIEKRAPNVDKESVQKKKQSNKSVGKMVQKYTRSMALPALDLKKREPATNSMITFAALERSVEEKFNSSKFYPYLMDVFTDLSQREGRSAKAISEGSLISKTKFLEYCNLPGLLGERLYCLFTHKVNTPSFGLPAVEQDTFKEVSLRNFREGLAQIFCGQISKMMAFTFKIFDFDNDGLISNKDVALIFNHIPDSQNKALAREELVKVFEDKDSLTLQQYLAVNTQESSDIFYSLISYLHDTLPCAVRYFQMRRELREKKYSTKTITRFASPFKINRVHQSFAESSHSNQRIEKEYEVFQQRNSFKQQVSKPFQGFAQWRSERNLIRVIQRTRAAESVQDSDQSEHTTKAGTEHYGTTENGGSSHDVFTDGHSSHGFEEETKRGRDFKVSHFAKQYFGKPEYSDSGSSEEEQSEQSVSEDDNCQDFEASSLSSWNVMDVPMEGFGHYAQNLVVAEEERREFDCFLKTKHNHMKEFKVVIENGCIYFYSKHHDKKTKELVTSSEYKVMHLLKESTVTELPVVVDSPGLLFPVKLSMHPHKRIMFCNKEQTRKELLAELQKLTKKMVFEDDYVMDKEIARGEFGILMKAKDKRTEVPVAVKVMESVELSPAEEDQLRNELQALKLVGGHDNISKLLEVYNTDYAKFIVMEYLEGGDLIDYLRRTKHARLSERRSKEIALQLGKAIQFFHGLGIIHRDIKLENIMMTDKSEFARPKFIDFGLCKMLGPGEKTQQPFGTLGYMAPEVLKEDPYAKSCDLWSFGCVIYALMCGYLPFDSTDENQIVYKTLKKNPAFEQPVWARISKNGKSLLRKLLKKKPDSRFTIEEALAHPWFSEASPDEIDEVDK